MSAIGQHFTISAAAGRLLLLLAAGILLFGCGSESTDGPEERADTQTQSSAANTADTPDTPAEDLTEPLPTDVTSVPLPAGQDAHDVPDTTPQTVSFQPASTTITQSVVLPSLSVTDFVLVSSRRTARTRMEYTVRIKVSNSSASAYENVLASLDAVPGHVTIVDGLVNVGNVPGNSTITSLDAFTFDADLTVLTGFEAFLWILEGNAAAPPPPPGTGGGPSVTGIFMNIDEGAIKGEADSDSHRDWIELDAYSEGIRLAGVTTSGATRDRTSFVLDGVTVDKVVDLSSTALRKALAEGRYFGEIQIDVIDSCDASPYTRYAITLNTAVLASVSLDSTAADNPTEKLGIRYTRITTLYTPVESGSCRLLTPVYSTQDGAVLGL